MFMFGRKHTAPPVSAVIVAAGSATRMEGIDKQQACIDDIPVVVHSVSLFSACPQVAEIVLVCREDQMPSYYSLVQDYRLDKVASVVKGGGTRQESVFRGVRACSPEAAFLAIHDGARPLVTPEEIGRCIQDAFTYGAAAVGSPVKDTIKICDDRGFVSETPNRDYLVAIGTPQVFDARLYRLAMDKAEKSSAAYTDDCQLFEKNGHPVYITRGSHQNIKITTPEDLMVAQAIMTFREGGEDLWNQ